MKIGVVGLGKLGLPLSLVFAKAGFEVYGVDINEQRIEEITRVPLHPVAAQLWVAAAARNAPSPHIWMVLDVVRQPRQGIDEHHHLRAGHARHTTTSCTLTWFRCRSTTQVMPTFYQNAPLECLEGRDCLLGAFCQNKGHDTGVTL